MKFYLLFVILMISNSANAFCPFNGTSSAICSGDSITQTYMKDLESSSFIDARSLNGFDSVSTLAARGVIEKSRYFRPNDYVSRAEFLKMMVSSFAHQKQLSQSNLYATRPLCDFLDVNQRDWSYVYVVNGTFYGFISCENQFFRPNDPITRQEAAKIATLAGGLNYTSPKSEPLFLDDSSISPELSHYVYSLRLHNVIDGYPVGEKRDFRPFSHLSRLEAASIVARLFFPDDAEQGISFANNYKSVTPSEDYFGAFASECAPHLIREMLTYISNVSCTEAARLQIYRTTGRKAILFSQEFSKTLLNIVANDHDRNAKYIDLTSVASGWALSVGKVWKESAALDDEVIGRSWGIFGDITNITGTTEDLAVTKTLMSEVLGALGSLSLAAKNGATPPHPAELALKIGSLVNDLFYSYRNWSIQRDVYIYLLADDFLTNYYLNGSRTAIDRNMVVNFKENSIYKNHWTLSMDELYSHVVTIDAMVKGISNRQAVAH